MNISTSPSPGQLRRDVNLLQITPCSNESEVYIKKETKEKIRFNSNLVQIIADNEEVNRRINAFIERKQKEVNDINIREFCNVLHTFQDRQVSENSCARTDAVFVARGDCKSHVKVSKVLNEYGPQTKLLQAFGSANNHISGTKPNTSSNHDRLYNGLEERLQNLEEHIGMKADEKDIFRRVKALEERVLYLESLSPEYFHSMPKNLKRKDGSGIETYSRKTAQNMDVPEIDDKIASLKHQLMAKRIKMEPS